MDYQHKIIQKHPQSTVWTFYNLVPYIPNDGDLIGFPDDWEAGSLFEVTSVQHYPLDKTIIINVNLV